jgi:hypothetical protein
MLNKEFIQVYPDFIAKEDINNLNVFLYQQGPVVIKDIYFLEKLNDAEIEVAPNFEIKNKTIQKIMKDAEAKVIEHITNVYFPKLGYEAELKWSRPLELIRWGHNARLDDHTDAPKPTDDETVHISALIYINDNYTGGEINFPEYEIDIKPKTNDLIVFSGSMTHNVGFVGERTDEEQDERRFTMPFFFDFKIKPYSE